MVQAYFRYAAPQLLTISTTDGGTTSPEPGSHWYAYDTVASVTAYPDQGSSFSYWLLDGEYIITDDCVYVDMESYHSLEAHFDEALPSCALTINAIELCSQQSAETNVYVDSSWVGSTDLTYYSSQGNHEIVVDDRSAEGYYIYYYEIDGEICGYGTTAEITLSRLHKTITFFYVWGK